MNTRNMGYFTIVKSSLFNGRAINMIGTIYNGIADNNNSNAYLPLSAIINTMGHINSPMINNDFNFRNLIFCLYGV